MLHHPCKDNTDFVLDKGISRAQRCGSVDIPAYGPQYTPYMMASSVRRGVLLWRDREHRLFIIR